MVFEEEALEYVKNLDDYSVKQCGDFEVEDMVKAYVAGIHSAINRYNKNVNTENEPQEENKTAKYVVKDSKGFFVELMEKINVDELSVNFTKNFKDATVFGNKNDAEAILNFTKLFHKTETYEIVEIKTWYDNICNHEGEFYEGTKNGIKEFMKEILKRIPDYAFKPDNDTSSIRLSDLSKMFSDMGLPKEL